MRALPQALEITFEVQRKGVKQEENKLSNLQNAFFYFLLFGPLLLGNLITFLFLIHFK
jgi:hypothetical protein